MLPYPDYLDKLIPIISVIVYCATSLLFGVAFPITPFIQSLGQAGWSLWALGIDNVLSLTFIHQLYKSRTAIGDSKQQVFRKVIRSLATLLTVSWLCLALAVAGTFIFPKNNIMRTLCFRFAYAFSPCQFTGALVFVKGVKQLLGKKTVQIPSQSPLSSGYSEKNKSTQKSLDRLSTPSTVSAVSQSLLKSSKMADNEA
jgi:hypothetical protein